MKRFSFTLQSILNHKVYLEDASKRILGKEIQKKNLLTEKLNGLVSEKKGLIELQAKAELSNPAEFMYYVQFHQKLESDIQYKYSEISNQDEVIHQKTMLLNKAVIERKKIDKLKEREFKSYKKDRLKQEVKFLDEVSSRDPHKTQETS